MTKRRRTEKPQTGGLADAGLFEAAMSDATPLDRDTRRRYVTDEEGYLSENFAATSKQTQRRGQGPERRRSAVAPAGVGSPATRPQHSFDRATMRQVKQGKLTVDRKLDLHGLTQAKAHDRLIGFIDSAARSGCRCVLVITGKGVQVTERPVEQGDSRERGVLRRMVPVWLTAGNLAPLVVDFQSALPKHGGDGAFYVRLRRLG